MTKFEERAEFAAKLSAWVVGIIGAVGFAAVLFVLGWALVLEFCS